MCYTLEENLSTFYSSPETLWETETKSSRLVNLAEEISRQPSIQAILWLLTSLQKARLKNLKNLAGGQKGSTRKIRIC